MASPRVAVIGAGVVGLSTAVQIQEAIPNVAITIIADKFNKETTSDGAAGTFRPTAEKTPGVDPDLLKKWSQDSWDHYDQIYHSTEAKEAGISLLSGYQFFDDDRNEAAYKDMVYHYRPCTDREMEMFPIVRRRHGIFSTIFIVECRFYLPWLMAKYRANGGKVQMRTVESFGEFVAHYDVVVNCMGMESKRFFKDDRLVPIRGQMIRVKAPWITHFAMVDDDCWVLPGMETVTIGGTRQVGDTNLKIVEQDSKDVWERALRVYPSLAKAEWMWEWVGLRPHRAPPRVEKQVFNIGKSKLKVVHNYGHGGNGVTLSWGTSKHATQLVMEMLQEKQHETSRL